MKPTTALVSVVPPGKRAAEALLRLRAAGVKRSVLRGKMLEVLAAAAPRHLTVREIHQALGDAGWPADLSAVYRTMSTFAEYNVVHTVGIAGPPAYGLSDPPHHHTVCRGCGEAAELPHQLLEDAIVAIAEVLADSTSLQPDIGGLTIHGWCSSCRKGGSTVSPTRMCAAIEPI